MHDFTLYRSILANSIWQTSAKPLSPNVAQWLLHKGSLTEKLQQQCSNLQVKIVQEGWQARGMCQNSAEYWVREVLLKCSENDWIFAQTIIPQKTVDAVASSVLNLGEQAIGLWLFPQKPTRLSLEWQQDPKTKQFARRSQLLLKNYPLEIRELFLSHFLFETTPIKA
ncbi:chorismate lyase [Nicoletella semolina]|uniref:Chorismate lyase n=1 Tax=Nicoletella semolina TaxID=271160 RepID=A0A4R2N5D7_9PAST|nr:chorismate lyase [Nicoletella semolina]MDH2924792.1 4-hydroxybenzoate synthetase [Nicoletella semolina]TCP16011.1 chorismate lyase [Nicoletella semolina]